MAVEIVKELTSNPILFKLAEMKHKYPQYEIVDFLTSAGFNTSSSLKSDSKLLNQLTKVDASLEHYIQQKTLQW